MERGEANYGLVKTSNFLPTVSALRYLNCCRTVGWHNCNKLYHLKYEKGVAIVFLVYTVKGAGRIRAAVPEETSKSWVLTEGTLCMIPADTPMEYGTLGSGDEDFWEFYWLNLDGDYVRRTAEKLWQDGHAVHTCKNQEHFKQIFHRLLHSAIPEKSREMEHSSMIQDLLQKLLAELMFERKTVVGVPESAEVSEQMLEYMQENYDRKISLEEFSKQFFLSKNQIIRIFRKRTGYAPYEYIKHYRLLKACELLQGTEIPVGEVGGRVGYCNSSHFAAQFRECYGVTPSEYRGMFVPRGE
jgi:AraC-like DNA-binding protein